MTTPEGVEAARGAAYRVSPASEEAERAVLGSMLLAPKRVIDLCIRSHVTEETFFVQWHRIIYAQILKLHALHPMLDILIFSQAMRDFGLLDQAGGNAYIEKLIDSTPTEAHAEYYIDVIRQKEILRALITVSRETIEEAYSCSVHDSPEELVSKTQAKLSGFVVRTKTKSLHEAATESLDKWEDPNYRNLCLSWPWESMNTVIGPLTDEYVILAAQPSVGKTALALNMHKHLSDTGRISSLLSLESKIDKIAGRLMAQTGRVNTFLLRTAAGTPEEFYKARAAAAELAKLRIRITDEAMNIDQVRAWAHGEKEKGSTLLVVDNLKHIRCSQTFKSRIDQFAEMSLQLKFIRDDTGLPLIVLHHLNDEDKLAWSKDIERDADIILIMSDNESMSVKPTFENHFFSKWVVDVSAKKHREGKTGDLRLEFVKKYQYFQDYRSPTEDAPPADQQDAELFSQRS